MHRVEPYVTTPAQHFAPIVSSLASARRQITQHTLLEMAAGLEQCNASWHMPAHTPCGHQRWPLQRFTDASSTRATPLHNSYTLCFV